MFKHSFYFSTIRKYVSLMGTLFDDIVIERSLGFSANTADNETFNPDPNASATEIIDVPITYANKDKMLARVIQDPTLGKPEAVVTLPLMSFEMTSMQYDSARKLETTGRVSIKDPTSNNNLLYQYNPVPYNLQFKLSVFVQNVEDGIKIIEHILPFFTPEWTTTCVMIPEMNIREDVSVILHSVSCEDRYDGDYKNRRAIIWDLEFTLKGRFYGPVKRGPIIQFIDMPMYVVDYPVTANNVANVTFAGTTVQVTPGLDANGDPTSNASIAVNTNLISVNSDYGFITTITDDPIA